MASRSGDDPERIDPLLVADTVPARAAPRRASPGRGEPDSGDPRVEGPGRPARRPRVVTRADLPDSGDQSDLVWAAAAPLTRDEPTGPIDTIPPTPGGGAGPAAAGPSAPAVRASVVALTPPGPAARAPAVRHGDDRTAQPLTGVPVPVVVPGTPLVPAPPVEEAPLAVAPPVVVARQTRARRKDRPKVVRLPRRARIRKVSRVVRSVDAWSVFKVSVVFYLAMYVVFLVAGVLLWNVAYSTGTIDNISSFFESFGWENFEFNGGEIYHNAWIIGLFAVAGLTGLNVVLATLYNLITDLVGGIRLTVLEEEVLVRAAPTTAEGTPSRPPSTTTIAASRRVRRARSRSGVG